MVPPIYPQQRPSSSSSRLSKNPTAEALETFLRESGITEHQISPHGDYTHLLRPCEKLYHSLITQAYSSGHSNAIKLLQQTTSAKQTQELITNMIQSVSLSYTALEQGIKGVGSTSTNSDHPHPYTPTHPYAYTAHTSHPSHKQDHGHLVTSTEGGMHYGVPGVPAASTGPSTKMESVTRSSIKSSVIQTPPVGASYYQRDGARRQFQRPREAIKNFESGGSADRRASPAVKHPEKQESHRYRSNMDSVRDPIGPPLETRRIPPATPRGAPVTLEELKRMLKETKSAVYDHTVKMSDSDIYNTDLDAGYKEATNYTEATIDSRLRDDEAEVTRGGLIFRATVLSGASTYRRSSHLSSPSLRLEECGAFASLHSSSSNATPRSIPPQPPATSTQRGNGSPTELSQAAEDDELFTAVPASPSVSSTLPVAVGEPQPRIVAIEKPSMDTTIPFADPIAPTSATRSKSPTFGKEASHKAELVPPPGLDDVQNSPTFGGTQQVNNAQHIVVPAIAPAVVAPILASHESQAQLTEDAEKWDEQYAKGSHTRLRREKQNRKRELGIKFRYPESEGGFPKHDGEKVLDCFSLKIIYERDKTGFQETREFKAGIDKVIAGRYQIIGEIGKAAFSTTFKCRDLQNNVDVCLKVISNYKDYIDQSFDEIQILRYIRANADPCDSRCLELTDFFYYEEHLILVTELLGDNLYCFEAKVRTMNQGRFFSLGRIQKIAYQILIALSYIHSLRLIHSDLKPENIVMVDETFPLVKLIDFGSACFEDDSLSSYVQSRSYRAPEVILGLCYDQKIDIWSLGCVLAELWTGFVLFQNQCVQSMIARIVSILGLIPSYMVEKGKHKKQLFTPDGRIYKYLDDPPDPIGGRRVKLLYPKKSSLEQRMRTTDKEFLAFLKSLLQIDPVKRPTANEALQSPWFSRGRYDDGL